MQAGDKVFAFATTEARGREPWVTDGTDAGTRLLRDICPGRCSSDPVWHWSLGDRLLFIARTESDLHLPEAVHRLWVSDGTWQGTRELGTPWVSEFPEGRVGALEDPSRYFFIAADPEPPGELTGLWVTDGTPAGTRGPLGRNGPHGPLRFARGFSIGRETMVFKGFTATTGHEPWITDGTDAGTRLIRDLVPGPVDTSLGLFRRLPDATLFFQATGFPDSCTTTLWRSDGTAPGTVPLLDLDHPNHPGTSICSTAVQGVLPVLADAVFFIARDGDQPFQIWLTDGTAAGTRQLSSFTSATFQPQIAAAPGGTVLFGIDDGVHGMEPWMADAEGARLLADVCPGTCSSQSYPREWFDGVFYFRADDGIHGIELWRTDGTEAGTRMVQDLCPGSCTTQIGPIEGVGDQVFFVGGLRPDMGAQEVELYVTSRDAEGAVRLTDFDRGFPFTVGTPPFRFSSASIDGLFLFPALGQLWRSDGTPEGTRQAADIETFFFPGADSDPVLITPWGSRVLLFARGPDAGYQPWISDGTEAGTLPLGVVVDPEEQSPHEVPYADAVALGAKAVFMAKQGDEGPLELWSTSLSGPAVRTAELAPSRDSLPAWAARLGNRAIVAAHSSEPGEAAVWTTDGTAAGTRRLRELRVSSSVGELDGRLYFGALDPVSGGSGLWTTDGTEAGTIPVVNLDPNGDSQWPHDFANLGGDRLLFRADELWITDGTEAGTRRLTELVPDLDVPSPRSLTGAGGRVYFFAEPIAGEGRKVWVTDGTAEGTRGVAIPVREAGISSLPTHAGGRGRFFFVSEGSVVDHQELWVSDGTAEGTGSLRPLFPASAEVLGVWGAGDRVHVSISEFKAEVTTYSLWETDGTLDGTRQLVSFEGYSHRGPVTEFAEAGGLLFFDGTHPEAGKELMALPLGPPEPCVADDETLCLGDGRFAVTVRWRDPRTGDEGVGGALPLEGSDRTGLFWFFDPDNVELVVKNLDGGPVNGYFWNFYGALSDVEYTIEVVDTATGRRVEYFNPGGEICGRGDTRAFLSREPVPFPVPPEPEELTATSAAGSTGTACGGDPTDLCLLDDRFRVEVEWTDHRSGDSGVGVAVPGTERSGFFWFFDDQNIELVVKMLDGRTVNGRFWVFYGALSDVEYTITVTDTEALEQATYHNPPGEICGRGDTAAF